MGHSFGKGEGDWVILRDGIVMPAKAGHKVKLFSTIH